VKLRFSLVLALVVCVAAATPFAAATDPNVGHWKLNAEKSKGAVFKSGTVDIEAQGEGVKTTVDLVKTDGTPSRWSFTANYDGKDNPITGDCPFGNAVTLTRVNTHTTRGTTKQDGKVTLTQTAVISPDGKTRTLTSKGKDLKGNPIASTTVYDRQ
jgi:hypothetical protein